MSQSEEDQQLKADLETLAQRLQVRRSTSPAVADVRRSPIRRSTDRRSSS